MTSTCVLRLPDVWFLCSLPNFAPSFQVLFSSEYLLEMFLEDECVVKLLAVFHGKQPLFGLFFFSWSLVLVACEVLGSSSEWSLETADSTSALTECQCNCHFPLRHLSLGFWYLEFKCSTLHRRVLSSVKCRPWGAAGPVTLCTACHSKVI